MPVHRNSHLAQARPRALLRLLRGHLGWTAGYRLTRHVPLLLTWWAREPRNVPAIWLKQARRRAPWPPSYYACLPPRLPEGMEAR